MAEIKKTAESVSTTPNGNGATELVNMSHSELLAISKSLVGQVYDKFEKLFPENKFAVCAVMYTMLKLPIPSFPDIETATKTRETLLRFAETHQDDLCKQAAAAITVQGGAT